MGNEVNEVINNICSKLGYAASEITPEMARYMIAKCTYEVIVCIVLMIIAVIAGTIAYKSYKNLSPHDQAWNSTLQFTSMILSIAAFIILTLALAFAGAELVGWIASPRASMVQYVLEQIK